ncbi:alpha/beta fold hydrolase [Thalassotalea sp. HSM 43]|uniref:alpha/beta fold hydrolase n=1 Tax=Thalassotalea sp. HSM 43 TaxID=2552945 RepID=UPI0016755958|nr:alpha/beta hydrolase [Thalassotalea sp. HSM 43]
MTHTVYLLAGTMCSARMFHPLTATLTNVGYNTQTIAFSTEKSIDDMVQHCRKIITQPAIILGFSMGGMVALELAKQCPTLIQGLILLSSNSHADAPGRAEIRNQHIVQAKQQGLEDVIKHFYLPNYLYQPTTQIEQQIIAMATDLGLACFESQLMALATRADSLDVISKLSRPLLLIAGKNDRLCPEQEQYKMHNALQDSTLCLIDQCGHFPIYEQPQQTCASITDWLTTHFDTRQNNDL